MRTPSRQTWRTHLATLFGCVPSSPPLRTRPAFTPRLEPLEDRLAPVANLSVVKVDSVDPVVRGENITYSITVENTGDTPATNVTLNDLVPAGTTFVSFTEPAGWSSTTPAPGDTGLVRSTIPTLGPLQTASFTLVVRVDPDPAVTSVDNVATVNGFDSGSPISAADSETTTVHGPDLSVTKLDSPDPVVRGNQITYTILVFNPNPDGFALNAVLTDAVPTGTTFVSFSEPAGWSSTTPAPGGTGLITSTATAPVPFGNSVFTLVVEVDPTFTGGSISNVTGVTSADDPGPDNNFGEASTTVVGPDLSVVKVDSPDPVAAGGLLTYTITITNPGSVDAFNVSLTDLIPTGTTFVSFTEPANFTSIEPPVGGTGTITSTAASMAPGDAVFTLVVQVDANSLPGTLSNTATITSLDDPTPANDSDTEQTAVVGPDLTVSGTDSPDPVQRGDLITYTYTLVNPGPGNGVGVVVTDVIPTNTTFVSFTEPSEFSSTEPPVDGTGTITSTANSPLAPGNYVFTLVVRVDGGTTTNQISNTFSFVGANDSDGTNNSHTDLTDVIGPDVSVVKTDTPDPVVRGDLITYTITINNPGPGNALNVAMSDVVPTGTTFVSITSPAGFTETTTPPVGGTGTVTRTATSMAPGNAVFTLVVRVDAGTTLNTISNTATVTSTGDQNNGNDADTELTNVIGPDLALTKTDSPDPVVRGSNITYTLTLVNPGPGNALNVAINDVVPAGTTFVSLTVPAGFASTTPPVGGTGNVRITSPSMATGTAVFTLVVQVNAITAGTVNNTATVSSTNDPNTINDSDTEQTTVVGPDLVLTKIDSPEPVARGANLTYTITLTQPGPGNALNVTLLDAIPTGTTFVSFTAPAGFLSNTPPVGGTGNVTSTGAAVPGGASVFTLVVRVDPDTLELFVNNTATVTSLDESGQGSNQATAETSVTVPGTTLTAFEDTTGTFTLARFQLTTILPFTATINWGDGSVSTGTVVDEGNRTFSVRGTHLYTDESPHFPDAPFPISLMVVNGQVRFDVAGAATVLDRPFAGGERGTPDDRWLAEIEDNFRDPSLRSLNQDDATRMAFVNEWKGQLAQALASGQSPRQARRTVARNYLTRLRVMGLMMDVLGRIPRRLTIDDAARLIDAFYQRFLEHGGRSASWAVALATMMRLNRAERSVAEAVRIPLAEFLSSDEFYNKTLR